MLTAFVTGASSGLGKAIAFRLAKNGYHLVLTGRRKELLEQVAADIRHVFDVEILTLNFDIRDYEACKISIESMPQKFANIHVLVNNAGLAAGAEPFQNSDLNHYEQMIDTNIKGLLYVTKLIVPGMIRQSAGHIINISSIAGIEVYPNGSVYCATKHAVNAITKGLRLDLLKHGIKVGSISPGMVETEFSLVRYQGDAQKAKAVYAGIVPLEAEDIADILEFMVTRPEHVSINDVQVNPKQQANTYLTNRILN